MAKTTKRRPGRPTVADPVRALPRVTFRVPRPLYARLQAAIQARRETEPGYSLNRAGTEMIDAWTRG